MTLEMARVSSRGQIVIPRQVRRELGIKTGDSVMFKVEDGQAILTPLDKARIDALEDFFAHGRRMAKIHKFRRKDIVPAVLEVRYRKKGNK